jgi:hypothetical protein
MTRPSSAITAIDLSAADRAVVGGAHARLLCAHLAVMRERIIEALAPELDLRVQALGWSRLPAKRCDSVATKAL